ncbi:chromosomal replication initiator protein DnaA [Helicobacter anseris]|uniref:Chromosomal replication initiator protein DnaA n=1 Tax=Helicobacter anseris TaxID=375926 RepID=A0A3D8J5N8_9HELI|nr:chromosomal replication initiator protein DnaA [Helicobacter anseris]RDU72465.1 chromosomal replication initiator protein DnaA [Helicobacter anseris]
MTQKNLDEIFKKEFDEADYKTYISKIKYSENHSKQDIIGFCVANIFLANYIKTNYTDKIINIFEKYYNIRPQIRFFSEIQKKNVKNSKQIIQRTETILNPSYTFETFIQGESNKFAYEIAKQISEKQAKNYNPVLFYGGTGLGKTHLLNAIGNKVIEKNKNVIYVTAEQFMNDYIARLQSNSMDKFREKYRHCDYLLIDDVQFFGGKQQIQEEFFHTFNDLHSKNKQIVMTADKSLKQIIGLEDRLKSRFEWGITADIQPPGLETKIEIIKQKCIINRIDINQDIIEFLASNVSENIRQIEGLIIKLNAQSLLLGQTITLASAKNALKDIQKENHENISIERIIKAVAKEFNIKPSEIASKNKHKNIAKARRIVIFLSRQMIPNSMAMIAQSLNMKDHSAVSKAYTTVNKEINENASLKLLIDEIRNKL